jgi:lysozyme
MKLEEIRKIEAWIKKCEGFNTHPYLDATGKVTIGWGRNIDQNGINAQEAEFMLENDIHRCIGELNAYSWYYTQPSKVQMALINMCFNLGISKLLTFKKMIAALQEDNYNAAATECLNSEWAAQVGQRARDVAVMIRECNE